MAAQVIRAEFGEATAHMARPTVVLIREVAPAASIRLPYSMYT